MAAMRFEQVKIFILAKKYFGVRCTLTSVIVIKRMRNNNSRHRP